MGVTVNLFKPHDGQRKVIEGFADSVHKFGIVSTGRQYGKSLLASNLLVYWLLNNNDSKGGWVSPVYNQAKKVFQEISKACKDIITQSNKADLVIYFANGSSIQFLSSERPDSIRGFSFHYIVVDEGSFVKDTAIQEAILPTLTAIGRKCLMISTPKGKSGWFYEMHLRGRVPNNEYISFEGISTDNPYADANYIEEQRKSLPTEIYAQEYLAKFVDAGNDVFRNVEERCILNEWPTYNRTKKYYAGIDVGISDDYTVLTILEESGTVQSILRLNGRPIAEIGEYIIRELSRYSNIAGYCETNGIGRSVYELVRGKVRTIEGFTSSNESKTTAIRGLISDLENGVLDLPSKNLFPELYNELNAFTYKISPTGKLQFSHPNGMHDDCVDSLWLANHARNQLRIKATSKIYVGQFR